MLASSALAHERPQSRDVIMPKSSVLRATNLREGDRRAVRFQDRKLLGCSRSEKVPSYSRFEWLINWALPDFVWAGRFG